mmetsp:Transcript_31019/g.61872  ORF Transcript_31019/g.61872 Transcript_31019/m.61872 type:complete len:783 (+) Transcript_31019:49-2397(+)
MRCQLRHSARRRGAIAAYAITIILSMSPITPPTTNTREFTHGDIFFANASPNNIIADDEVALIEEAERMANEYTNQLDIIVNLTDENPVDSSSSMTKNTKDKIIKKGQKAFDMALKAFPDDTLPHAHALFAKLCTKMGHYEKALELFDEAIRRASLPIQQFYETENHADVQIDAMSDAEYLVKQLVLERNRSHFLFLQSKINTWDNANHVYHRGGIPPETSPMDPLKIAKYQLEIFPTPHPRTLFDIASLSVLLLDSPEHDDVENGDETTPNNATAMAWDAHKTFSLAQTYAFGAYTHGKKRNLVGGKACREDKFGVLVGGRAWSTAASEHFPMKDAGSTSTYMGTVVLENVVLSGRDAVPSGHGSNCHVYVPHRYVDLSNNLPMVTSWETSAMEITMDDNPFWSTYLPENDSRAFNGEIGKDPVGNDILLIPDPSKGRKRIGDEKGFDIAVLLTGYAAQNYYHFITEVLPSLVLMKARIRDVLKSENARDVVIVPNMQHEFVEGFLRLMIPEAFAEEGGTSSTKVVQWGLDKKSNLGESNNSTMKFASPHPITFVHRLYAAAWDQSEQAPPPGGPAHCLTPQPLLLKMQSAVWEASGISASTISRGRSSKLKIVYCSRSSSPTRKLKEENELLSRLEKVASSMNAELSIFEKGNNENAEEDVGADSSPLHFVKSTIELFSSADVVVGVHGASLANIVFSEVGTTVVEMGLEGLPQASHYRHLSQSLGLEHVDVFLMKDSRSLGATEVQLRLGGMNEVVGAVVEGLDNASKRRMMEQQHMEL